MFSYYGSKSKIIDCYPKPKHDLIIEPFAGSARYALKWFDRDVILNDKYKVVVNIWKWLQQCSEKDILNLPKLKPKQKTTDFNLTKVERDFLGFLCQRGVARPGITTSEWRDTNGSPTVADDLKRISANLFKIKHWEIRLGDFQELENKTAAWFIDPPYQVGGYKYPHNKIDYTMLSNWCQQLNGQVIVCENTKADWLPFKPMVEMQGTMFKTTEAIWSNQRTNYDAQQTTLQF